ncbi:hypothetical protein RRG08_058086 [Elysia crispata]|uniref:Uncharacterized protein n=1 Tax=Elysia crispata TaxID=231223 RepID=A0AAE0YGS6_9GAST|nr:hypothetical protein RRG08_058086 [Elysia crispata]
MAPLKISSLISSVYDLLPSNGQKEDPTCPLNQGRQTTEHVLRSCKIVLSQGRYNGDIIESFRNLPQHKHG